MEIEAFIQQMRQRLNSGRYLRYGLLSMTIAAWCGILYAFYFIFHGYSVYTLGLLWIALAGVLVGSVYWLCTRLSIEQSARISDDFLGLKDGLITGYHFRAASDQGEAYALIRAQVKQRISPSEVSKMPLRISRRWLVVGLLSWLILIGLAFVPPSDAVLAAAEAEKETVARVDVALGYLEETLEAFEEGLDEAVLKELELDKLKAELAAMEATGDPMEAMRQFAKFEQTLSDKLSSLDQAADEETLRKAAERLSESSMTEARQIAKALDAKVYADAAASMQAQKPSVEEPQEAEQSKEAQLTRLSEQAKELAKLRELSQRMASPQSGTPSQSSQLSTQLSEFEAATKAMEGTLQAAQLDPDSVPAGMCESGMCSLGDKMDELAKLMKQMDARRKASKQLASFRSELNKAQSFSNGQLAQLGSQAGNQPGKGVGGGSTDTRRDPTASETSEGQMTQVQGQKGAGPASTTTEAADSGTGNTLRTASTLNREYTRQFESFVQRDDIPLPVKSAVSIYFQDIHSHNTHLDMPVNP